MPSAPLSLRDGLLALAVMAVWGTNFVVIRLGLDHLPPLLFAALRFTLAVLPTMFLLPRPPVPWRKLAAYGLLIGAGQFGLMFIAISWYITPGLASLVIQLQAFFTIGLAAYLTGERVQRFQFAALLLSVAGIGVILVHTDAATTPLGLALVLVAAVCWAGGNVVVRSTPKVNMLAYVVWASLFSAPPLFVLSFAFEGWPAIRDGLAHSDLATWGAVLYQTVANTLFGYAAWGWLLSRYPGGDHRTHVAAGSGVRHGRFGVCGSRAPAKLEACRSRARHGGVVPQRAVAEVRRPARGAHAACGLT